MSLNAARLYLCTDARTRQGDFPDFVSAAYRGGVDIVQLRDKSLEGGEELELLVALAEVAAQHGRLWAVNDRADIARLAGAPVLHLGQKDLPPSAARAIVGAQTAIGRSTHTAAQVDAAIAAPDLGYFCVGPVWSTPTKPGRAAVGTELIRFAAQRSTPRPWFAIGGIDASTIGEVVDAGARRVVVVRAITDADDPEEAARRLCGALPLLEDPAHPQ
ncbi:thiamine phosphate synthase [Humibacter ginsengiterrae]